MSNQPPSADVVTACHDACEDLRAAIVKLGAPDLKRRDLAKDLGGILLRLEAVTYPGVAAGDERSKPARPQATDAVEGQTDWLQLATQGQTGAPRRKSASRDKTPGQLALSRATDEMKAALNSFQTNTITKVISGPGSGKTTLCTAAAELDNSRGLYLCYNTSIREAAASKFNRRVVVQNWHALAYAIVGAEYAAAGKTIRDITVSEATQLLDLGQVENKEMKAWAIRETFNAFLNRVDQYVEVRHVPDSVVMRFSKFYRNKKNMDLVQALQQTETDTAFVVMRAQTLWEMTISKASRAPMPHDAYLKLWLLRGAKIDTDWIAVDEFQDSTEVMTAIIAAQACRKILVGDPNQSIYGYRGAINAFDRVEGKSFNLTKSFRFGPNIAEAGNAILKARHEEFRIVGAADDPGLIARVDKSQPFTILTRTNAGLCVRAAECVSQYKTAVIGGASETASLMKSAFALYTNRLADVRHPSLSHYRSYTHLKEYAESTGDRDENLMVKLLTRHGGELQGLINKLENGLVEESEAHVKLSTTHKYKGREDDQVEMDDDFPEMYDRNGAIRIDEANLLFVAATRARKVLYPCGVLAQMMIKPIDMLKAAPPAEPLNFEARGV